MTWHLISRGTAALFSALLAAGTVAAASYPTRTLEIVVPYGAGGSTDLTARLLAQTLQDRLGQSFVVINRPPASGYIGVMSVVRRRTGTVIARLLGHELQHAGLSRRSQVGPFTDGRPA